MWPVSRYQTAEYDGTRATKGELGKTAGKDDSTHLGQSLGALASPERGF